MLIDDRVFEPYTIELNNPLTDEQWDILEDVDFDHTNHIWFHTKHGKEVHFYKNAILIEWIVNWLNKNNYHYCDVDMMLEDWEKENGK